MTITVDPSGLRDIPITTNPQSSDQFHVLRVSIYSVEDDLSAHTEWLNIYVFSLKKREMELIENWFIGQK